MAFNEGAAGQGGEGGELEAATNQSGRFSPSKHKIRDLRNRLID